MLTIEPCSVYVHFVHCILYNMPTTEVFLKPDWFLNLNSSIIKKYYKAIDGKEAQSLYKSPVIAKMKIKFFLKPANDLLAITSLLRLFHSFTTLLLKEYFAMSSLTLLL